MTRWLDASGTYPRLKSGARALAHSRGVEAYLVGSALTSETRPRDIDIRLVLPDDAFERRYNIALGNWFFARSTCSWGDAMWQWYDEAQECAAMLGECCGQHAIDLSILPQHAWDLWHREQPYEHLGAGPVFDFLYLPHEH